jgi:hypothetical protein
MGTAKYAPAPDVCIQVSIERLAGTHLRMYQKVRKVRERERERVRETERERERRSLSLSLSLSSTSYSLFFSFMFLEELSQISVMVNIIV